MQVNTNNKPVMLNHIFSTTYSFIAYFIPLFLKFVLYYEICLGKIFNMLLFENEVESKNL